MPVSKITVELLIDIAHIGRKGDIVEIASAQARNSLIPKKLVKEVTPDTLKVKAEKEKRAQIYAREKLEKAYELQKILDGQTLEFTLDGKNGKIFGGINEHEIVHRINQKCHTHLEKSDVKLPNKTHIKTAGTHLVHIHLTRDTIAKIVVKVYIKE